MEVMVNDMTWDDMNVIDTPESINPSLTPFTTWTLMWSEEREFWADVKKSKIIKRVMQCVQTHNDYDQMIDHWRILKAARLRVEVIINQDITLYKLRNGKHVPIPEVYEP
jgi:hypothetical protein